MGSKLECYVSLHREEGDKNGRHRRHVISERPHRVWRTRKICSRTPLSSDIPMIFQRHSELLYQNHLQTTQTSSRQHKHLPSFTDRTNLPENKKKNLFKISNTELKSLENWLLSKKLSHSIAIQ